MEISDVHKNTKLLIDSKLYNVEETEFMKPGKGSSIYRLKLRNLRDGRVTEHTYRSGDKVEEAYITSEEKQYLYNEGNQFVFMDTKTFEQHFIPEELIGDKKHFLKEGMAVMIQMMGDRPVDVTLPNFVEMKVVESEIATKSATITPQSKSSVLETGYVLETPAFIKEGDVIKIDTRTGTYVERIATKK